MPRKKSIPRRPRLRKKTREESSRFWQEYAQKFQDANNSITSGRSSLPTPTLLGGHGESDERVWSNGTAKRERTVFRISQDADSGGPRSDRAAYAAREKAAVEEARKQFGWEEASTDWREAGGVTRVFDGVLPAQAQPA